MAQEGYWAIENCTAGQGACHLVCGSAACNSNSYMVAWPNYTECSSHSCKLNTGVAFINTQCGGAMAPYSKCGVQGPFVARVWDCGPVAGQTAPSGNCGSGTHPVVACGNTAVLTAMCGGCNPFLLGHVYVGAFTP
jgi:hypothetical protein